MTDPITSVLLIGGTGSIGRRVAVAAAGHDLTVRAVLRNPDLAQAQLPGVDLIPGDLTNLSSLTTAVAGAEAIVFAHGGNGSPAQSQVIDCGGVATVLRALDGHRPRLALMTSIGVSRLGAYSGSTAVLMARKRRSERLARASGAPYTIVRPGWFDHVAAGDQRLLLEQTDTAIGRTFELFAEPGPAPTDWTDLFGALQTDPAGRLDGAGDPGTLPAAWQEPERVQSDLATLGSLVRPGTTA